MFAEIPLAAASPAALGRGCKALRALCDAKQRLELLPDEPQAAALLVPAPTRHLMLHRSGLLCPAPPAGAMAQLYRLCQRQ